MPKNVSDDFAYSIIDNYRYGNGNTKLFIMEKLRVKGYKTMDIDVLVESIENNFHNRNIILEVFYDYFSRDEEFLYANLSSLGIPAASSKYLTEYIIGEKYKSKLTTKVTIVKKSNNITPNQIKTSINKNDIAKISTKLELLNKQFNDRYIKRIGEDKSNPSEDDNLHLLSDLYNSINELQALRKYHNENHLKKEYLKKKYKLKGISDSQYDDLWEKDYLELTNSIGNLNSLYNDQYNRCKLLYSWIADFPLNIRKYLSIDDFRTTSISPPDTDGSIYYYEYDSNGKLSINNIERKYFDVSNLTTK